MANLQQMPQLVFPTDKLMEIGKHWDAVKSELPKVQGTTFGDLIDMTVGNALATMLGGIPVVKPKMNSLLPLQADCVEVGPTRVIGGASVRRTSMWLIVLTASGSPMTARP